MKKLLWLFALVPVFLVAHPHTPYEIVMVAVNTNTVSAAELARIDGLICGHVNDTNGCTNPMPMPLLTNTNEFWDVFAYSRLQFEASAPVDQSDLDAILGTNGPTQVKVGFFYHYTNMIADVGWDISILKTNSP